MRYGLSVRGVDTARALDNQTREIYLVCRPDGPASKREDTTMTTATWALVHDSDVLTHRIAKQYVVRRLLAGPISERELVSLLDSLAEILPTGALRTKP